MYVGVKILWGVKFKWDQTEWKAGGDRCRQNTLIDIVGKPRQMGKSACPWKLALSDATANSQAVSRPILNPQRGKRVEQSQSSAALFLKFDSVLDFQAKRVTALLFSFQKSCCSQLFFFFFCQGFCSSKTDFSGTTLMRPSHRFHGDSHKTVKFPVFQKSCGGGVLQLSQTRFQRACRCFQRWTFHFLVNSAGLWILFIKTYSFTVSKNASTNIGE